MKRYASHGIAEGKAILLGILLSTLWLQVLPGGAGSLARAASATVSVFPASTLPNETVTLAGTGYPANTAVSVSVTINLRSGNTRSISASASTDSNGRFSSTLDVPNGTAPGAYTLTASAGGVQATTKLQVLPLSAHPQGLGFQQVSLWYHTVRQGTWDYVSLQSTWRTQLGLWIHVIFPSGHHQDYYLGTDDRGSFSMKFPVPRGSASSSSNHAYVSFQLWHGKQTTQTLINFTVI